MIDKEMLSIGAHKVKLPHLLSSASWKTTGRWESNEMYKFEDRKGSEFCLGPTHEEEITQLTSSLISSYKDLPLYMYQIGTKFRDEKRPRGGLLRGKEFMMKDLYTFDVDDEEALLTYEKVYSNSTDLKVRTSYKSFFSKLGLDFKEAVADSGDIGGDKSHEYHLLSPGNRKLCFIFIEGEDTIISCSECGYCSNWERAQSHVESDLHQGIQESIGNHQEKTKIPGVTLTKGIVEQKDGILSLEIITPLGREVNPLKVARLFSNQGKVRILPHNSSFDEFKINDKLLLVDSQADYLKYVTFTPSSNIRIGDFFYSRKGDLCRTCFSQGKKSEIRADTAIEVGHTFFLGDKYSTPLNATFNSPTGLGKAAAMGCYGLGVSRLIGAIAEISRDTHGIIWPECIAPADICIIVVPSKNPEENVKLHNICDLVVAKMEEKYKKVILDDRNLSFPHKIKDSLLIGYPRTIIVGKSFLSEGNLEVIDRSSPNKSLYLSIQDL